MKKLLMSGLLITSLAACGSTEKEPEALQIITTDANNQKSDNNGVNNGADNNGVGNNGTTGDINNGTTVSEPAGLALLGDNEHTSDSVEITLLAGSAAGLKTPRDLAFHPNRPTELWVLNLDDNSTIVFDDPNQPGYTRYAALGKDHFMARPASLAFGENGNFATANEEDELTQGNATPEDFMGPTLWSSDRAVYDGGHGGHLDMLHNSPNGAGVAWETDNVYWIFDGYHASLTRYDFGRDHGPGGSDHSDGDVARFVEGEVGYVGDVPSHIEFDQDEQMLYVADTGNNRIAVLDPSVGEMGQRTSPNYDGGAQYAWNGGQLETFVEGADVMLEVPSGLEIRDGMIFVSDNKLSRIVAIDKATGALVDYLDLADQVPTGGLMGMAFGPEGDLYVVNAVDSQILRIGAKDDGGSTN